MRTPLDRRLFCCGPLLCLLTATLSSAMGQETPSAAGLARYLDDATLAVVIVDLERFDVAALAETIGTASSDDRPAVEVSQLLLQYLRPAIAQLRDQGVTHVYAAYSLHDVTRQMPYLILPTANAEQAGRVARYLEFGNTKEGVAANPQKLGVFESVFTDDSVVLAGNRDLQKRLDEQRIPDREAGLRQALAVEHEAPIRVIGVLTEDQRRVIAEMFPTLSDEQGGLSGQQMAGLQWLSVGIDLSKGTLQGVVQTKDDDTAQAVADGLPQLVAGVASYTFDKPVDEAIRATLRALQAESDGSRLSLSMKVPDVSQRANVVASLMQRIAPSARDVNITRNLKQLGLAMHNFHDLYLGFPPPASFDDSGNALLSWRVYLLPYIDENKLYNEFHLNEPWDSEHNRQLIPRMPDVLASEHFDLNLAGKTTLLLPVGEQAGFHGEQGIRIRDITDGTSNTIMIVEAPREHAVFWTQPEDFPIDRNDLKSALFGSHDKFWTAFFDGSARAFTNTISEVTLRQLFTHAGGEIIGEF